jgi:mRNA-degrading endonuclease RelE of RelBE toxin-antitoxin system
MANYEIKASKSVAKDWAKLEKNLPDGLDDCKKFLQENPLNRLKASGKLKKLKGSRDGTLQYDIDDCNRVWYKVDSKQHIVEIKYIGNPHL